MRLKQSYLTIALLSIVGVAVCLLVLQRFPMLHDYPEWVYQGWLFMQLLAGEAAFADHYALVAYPVPNSLSQFAIALLSSIVGPVLAAKIWLGLYLSVAVALCWHLWQRYRDSAQVLIFTSAVVLGPGFWNGYVNFQFAVLLFGTFLLISPAYQQNFVIRLLWSLLIFFAHATVFGIFILYCVASTWIDNKNRPVLSIIKDTALLPSLILLMWYAIMLLSSYVRQERGDLGFTEWAQYKVYTLAKQGPFHNYILHNGESLLERADWFYKLGFVTNFVFALLLLGWFAWIFWIWLSGRETPVRSDKSSAFWAVLLAIVACVAIFLLAGANTFGVVNLGERFLIVALLIALLCLNLPDYLKHMMAVVTGAFLLYLVSANVFLSVQKYEAYAVSRSSSTADLAGYVDDIYANTRHKYFNHRLFIYADRGLELLQPAPQLLTIDLETSVIRRVP